ncbi:energy-coupling factor transport system ATP-binding protein [Paenibacillus turicensis]|uniref:Energy-coupling factor transport system ATP-binding protein n=1 Tax=Paenibacillus turicensis TaxID=160487 RepID=A0ABS4FX05_9BACL|nr:ATP-binding cassette domain-containing protein [Paenibacillus turicensis]MBP1906868.1 energy-coupling factor transport system ATP-binding protein [Paenibacillus turicensis]
MTHKIPAFELQEVSFAYAPEQPVLSELTFSIATGQWVSLVGANGSGKSTLARLLGGLLAVNAGVIKVDGTELNQESAGELMRRIGMVFQNPDNQFIGATVEEDIAFGLESLCLPREEMLARIKKYSSKLQIESLLSKHPSELSGGQKQKVAITAILAMEPDFIILDEATSMLDEKARGELMAIVEEMRSSGQYTIISITHDPDEILKSDRVIVLQDGCIAADLAPQALFMDQALMEACHLLPPYSVLLVQELAQQGLEIPVSASLKEVEEALWQLYLKR